MNKDFWLKPEPYPYVVIPLSDIQKTTKTSDKLVKALIERIDKFHKKLWRREYE